MDEIPDAKRELEYIALVNFKLNTRNGVAYMFMAIDAFSGRTFNLNTVRSDNPRSVLKCVKRLIQQEEFKGPDWPGFTLVFEEYESLAERIQALIKPINGKLMYNKAYANVISTPFQLAIAEYTYKK